MASKKKTLTPGEMRPLSALKKQESSSAKKRNSLTRVPEPPKFPQYGVPSASAPAPTPTLALQNPSQDLDKEKVIDIKSVPDNNNDDVSQNNQAEHNSPMNLEEAAAALFKGIRELEKSKSAQKPIPKQEPEIKPESKPEPEPKPESELKSKLDPMADIKPQSDEFKPEIKSKPKIQTQKKNTASDDQVHVAFSKPVSKPLDEYKQASKPVTPPRRRGTEAPDLLNKAERDAFFSKYTTLSEKKKDTSFPDITDEYIRKQESLPKEKKNSAKEKRMNPFLTARKGRTLISHAKEEIASPPIGAKPADSIRDESLEQVMDILNDNAEDKNRKNNKPFAETEVNKKSNDAQAQEVPVIETATPEMRETIEGVVELQRKEREEAKAKLGEEEITELHKKTSIIRSVGIMSTIAVCGVFLLFGKRSDFSAEENRKLAVMPEFSWNSYLNGEYTNGVSAYYNDTVPMRSTFKKAISSMNDWKGLPSDDEKDAAFFGNVSKKENNKDDKSAVTTSEAVNIMENTQTTAVTSQTGITTTTEPEDYEPPVEVGDSIIIHKKRAISFFGGLDSIAESYANTLNDFKTQLPDVNVYSLIAPTSVSFYLPDEYKDYTANEKEKIDYVNDHLQNVKPVDAYTILEQHKDENIYARTDHHWLPLGAYYASQKFAETAGVPFTDISKMDSETKDDYVGTMYTFTESTILSENPEEFTYYKPRNKYKTEYYTSSFEFNYEGDLLVDISDFDPVGYYLVFMMGDDKIVHVSTDTDNNRTLVIFKDSYGNAMVPCLVGSFSDIYVCDIRYFNLNAAQFCRDVEATDLLFAMNTFSATGGNEDCIEQILYYQ